MNVQLYAYEGTTRYELDLYEEEPIKITLSSEEITDPTQINSTFSRQFRIPATSNNTRFFKYWYVAGVVDFDVTQKVKSEIHVDGILYRTGQIRLQAAYVNGAADHIEFEVVFLGETKDFASQIGEFNMNDLDLTDTAHILNYSNIQNSWLSPGDTNLLFDGAIRYIVAERGNAYDDNGDMIEVPGATYTGEVSNGRTDSFTQSTHPIHLSQFTPIVNVKYLIDKIFELTDYTYSSTSVFNDPLFADYLYIDGIGTGVPYTPNSDARFNVQLYNYRPDNYEPIPFNVINLNNSNAYNTTTYKFTAPADGSYTFEFELNGRVYNDDDPGQPAPTAEARLLKNGSSLYTNTQSGSGGLLIFYFTHTGSYTLNAGDEIWIDMVFTNFDLPPQLVLSTFEATNTPTAVTPSDMMKSNVKIIDWFKSILTKFRLVMVPSITNSLEFEIQPWSTYIGSGQDFDWTKKLDYSKDVKIEPLFYEQVASINFTDQEDEDRINDYNQTTYNKVYGERDFVSNNELLSDDKEITTVFAPTPVNGLIGASAATNFIVPVFAKFGDEETSTAGETQIVPVEVKPRLLYWNGNRSNSGLVWHYHDGGTGSPIAKTTYPCASYLSEIPTTSTTLNLNWRRQFAYFSTGGGPTGDTGESVYERYWKTYLENIYSPDARLLTAYFNLSSEDLRNLTFDDVIFIKDSYWRLQKIYDAPLGEVATVKCELIKLLDYVTPLSLGGGVIFDPSEYSESTSGSTGGTA